MRKIAKYLMICDNNPNAVNDAVNKYIEEGYQPYGEPIISMAMGNHSVQRIYGQAVVKYAPLSNL